MTDLTTLAGKAEALAGTTRTDVATAVTEIKTLLTTRVGDILIAAIALIGVWIGHSL
jgi:hypothetical protein